MVDVTVRESLEKNLKINYLDKLIMEQVDGGCFGKIKNSENLSLEDNNNNSPPESPNGNNNVEEAFMPVDQHDIYFKMSHQSRGLLIIFNHENFNPSTKQDVRTGTDEDVQKITKAFNALGFEIRPYKDLTLKEIRNCIWHCMNEDHHNSDCLAIFVLSHGDKNVIFAKDTWYNPANELWGRLTSDMCPSLAGKPKLIFLQACQGKAFDIGMKLVAPFSRTEFDGALRSYKLPICADFLIVYATFEGYFAFRNNMYGSRWVTILCQMLQENYIKLDVLTILTHVNRRLAVEFTSVNSVDKNKDGLKQMPYFKSSLTRILIFGEK